MGRKWISEHHTVKVLLEPQGAIVAFTSKTFSYLLFVTSGYVGVRRILTQDRIVARAHYSAPGALQLLRTLYPDGAVAAWSARQR
ncbi:MAG: hypothetical protein L3K15_06685 [Thermoplasmata archaeon]|nr:hypothetical protein [Thermoplasmata archaeon]